MTWLAKQFFFDHTITRKYLALVWGDLEKDGTVMGYNWPQHSRPAGDVDFMMTPKKASGR